MRFPGQWDEAETALLQNWHRDYDPTLGRYIEADPLGLVAGQSVYGYAGADPINAIDPLGLFQDDRGKKAPKRGKTKKLPKGGPLTALQLGKDFVNGINQFQDSVPGMFEPPANVPGMCTLDGADDFFGGGGGGAGRFTPMGGNGDDNGRCKDTAAMRSPERWRAFCRSVASYGASVVKACYSKENQSVQNKQGWCENTFGNH